MHPISRLRWLAMVVASMAFAVLAAGQASAANPPTVVDGLSAEYLQYTAWFDQNDLDPLGTVCVGVAGAHKGVVDTEHTTFQCRVSRAGKPAGAVIATALGPEWLRVTRIVSGRLKPDRGVGTVTPGPLAMNFHDAESALEHSSWARGHKVGKTFCTGVGPYKQDILGLKFGAFNCATETSSDQRLGTVLVQVVSRSSLRVLRTLS
jgi:hypothetical protein